MIPATDHPPLSVDHVTLVYEIDVPAPVRLVFETFASARLRAEWGAPSQTAVIIYDAEDFREGGIDRFRCGPKREPDIHGTTYYVEIIRHHRIVSMETVASGGRRLCASLTTVEFKPEGNATKLKSTTQLASFVGEAMVDGHRSGHASSLGNLVRFFKGRDLA